MKTSVGIFVMAAWINLSLQQSNPTTDATPATETTTTADTTHTTTGTTTAATTAAPSVTTTTSAPVDHNQRPVNPSCQAKYISCKTEQGSTTPPEYCAAYEKARPCIENSKNCTPPDNATLQFFDCGPQDFYNVTISSPCRDRVTECLAQTYANKTAPAIQDFKTVFCAMDSKEACIKKESDSSKCNANEVTVALKIACSAPQALLSSALFISLAFILQRLLKDY